MKKKYLWLLLFSSLFISCSNNDHEIIASNDINSQFLTNKNQNDFIKGIIKINTEYKGNSNTRITQKDVARGTQWVLSAAVDGLGGAVGAGWFSWLTGAAASTLYDSYLDKCKEQISTRSFSYECIDVANSEEYNRLYKSISFSFCNHSPKNIRDSIGYLHNEVLNAFMLNNKTNYISNNIIDFDTFNFEYRKFLQANYPSKDIDQIFNQSTNNYLNNLIKSFASLQVNTRNANDAFSEIQLSLYNDAKFKKDEALFLSTLVKEFILSFEYIPLEEIPSYSEKISNAIEQSGLSNKDVFMCKEFFQVMVCSYLYWGSVLK